MKTTRVQTVQESRAAKTPRNEIVNAARNEHMSEAEFETVRAYAPAGAAMAPIASPALDNPGHARTEYLPGEGTFLDESDIEMNRHMHGTSVALEKTDDEDDTDMDHVENVASYEEENEEDDDEEYADPDADEQAGTSAYDDGEQSVEPAVSVKDIVRNINRIAVDTFECGKREIGQYVFTVVFKGNIDDVLSRNPYKTDSMRRISEDPELRVDRRRLSNWVRAAALHKDLEANNIDCSQITTYQFVALLRVKDTDKRRELAKQVIDERLSVRQISERADKLDQSGKPKSIAKLLQHKIEDPLSLLKDNDAIALLKDEHRLAKEIPFNERAELVTTIYQIGKEIAKSQTFLDEVRGNLFAIDIKRLRRRTT